MGSYIMTHRCYLLQLFSGNVFTSMETSKHCCCPAKLHNNINHYREKKPYYFQKQSSPLYNTSSMSAQRQDRKVKGPEAI